jgi:hypothetical protein
MRLRASSKCCSSPYLYRVTSLRTYVNLASHVSFHVDIPSAGTLLIYGKFWILQSLQVPILTCLSISVACDSRRRKASLYVTQATGFSSAYCTDKHTFNQMMSI